MNEVDNKYQDHQSQVTPNAQKQAIVQKGQMLLLVFIAIFIIALMFMPKKSKASHPLQETALQNNAPVLSDNLKYIEQMKKEDYEKSLREGRKLHGQERVISPPKLRTSQEAKISETILLRMNAPTSFNLDAQQSTVGVNSSSNNALIGQDNNSQFVNSQSDITEVSAQTIAHPEFTVPAGEMIPATLETAVNSDLPGMARAITTRNVYALTGGKILIPKGSTLVGQFNFDIHEGQSRILIVWMRVQMSNGVTVALKSQITDSLGRAGQGADFIDRHFFERFGTSALLSILGASTATAGVNPQDQYNSASQYRNLIADSFQQTAGQTLEKSINIRSTLQINQGTAINVFVAHDLDFANIKR